MPAYPYSQLDPYPLLFVQICNPQNECNNLLLNAPKCIFYRIHILLHTAYSSTENSFIYDILIHTAVYHARIYKIL
jgi:hypothetical protein